MASFFYYISAPAPLKSFDWKSEDCAAVLKKELTFGGQFSSKLIKNS